MTSDAKMFHRNKMKNFNIAKDSFNKMSPILKNRKISMTFKIPFLKGYECWTLPKIVKVKIK